MLKALLRSLLFLALAVTGIVVLFVAWWMAVFLVLGVVGWYWFRRLFGAPPQPPGGMGRDPQGADGGKQTVVIEGEFEVEGEQPAPPGVLISPGSPDRDRPNN